MAFSYQPIGYYTRELKKRLPREYFKPVPYRLLWMIPYLLIVTVGIGAIALLPMSWVVKLALSVPIGLGLASLGLLGHEILHGGVTRVPWLRTVTGFICFMQFNLGPTLWRKWHNVEHHGHTQHIEHDPDRSATLAEFEHSPGVRKVLFWFPPFLQGVVTFLSFGVWFTLYALVMLFQFYGEFNPRERKVVLFQYALSWVPWLALLIWIGPLNFLFAYIIPVMIANFIVMGYIATNHVLNPITPINDPLANSLTVKTARWIDVMHFNFSHHTEHHLFPAMCPKYAPKVKALVKELWPERYHELPHWKAFLYIWRTPRLYKDETSLTDPIRGGEYPVLGHGMESGALDRQK